MKPSSPPHDDRTARKLPCQAGARADLRGGLQPCSYGFRPGRRAQDAIADDPPAGHQSSMWVLDADIKAFLDAPTHCSFR